MEIPDLSPIMQQFPQHKDALENSRGRVIGAIEKTVATYNQTVGSLERNVLPSARKFKELQPANALELGEVETIELPRRLDASKWAVNS